MSRARRFSDLRKREYKRKDGYVVVIRQEDHGRFGVEQFDANDMSRWHKLFLTFGEALVEFNRWRDE